MFYIYGNKLQIIICTFTFTIILFSYTCPLTNTRFVQIFLVVFLEVLYSSSDLIIGKFLQEDGSIFHVYGPSTNRRHDIV